MLISNKSFQINVKSISFTSYNEFDLFFIQQSVVEELLSLKLFFHANG